MTGQVANDARISWSERGFFLALLVICLLPLSKNQPGPDFWGHVQYGSDVLREGLPETATYSYNAVGNNWVNHETLSELAMALGIQSIGGVGLLCIKCLLGAGLMAVIIHGPRRAGASQMTIVVIALFASINLMHFWLLRPQLISYMFFASLVLILDWAVPRGGLMLNDTDSTDRRRLAVLWLVVPLLAVWANSHGGFVAGYAVLVTFLVCRGIELFVRHGRHAQRTVFHFLAIVGVAGLATVVNPAGLELHAWLWQSLGTPRPEIVEWRAPELTSIAWSPWWLLVAVSVVAVCLTRKSRDPAHMVLLSMVLWQSIEHRRHIPFFVILFALWLVPHVDDLIRRFRSTGELVPTGAVATSRAGRMFLATTAAITLFAGITLFQQLTTMPVLRGKYPVSAFQFIEDEGLHGKLVVRFMWAQYAIGAFGSTRDADHDIKVAFDGRFRTCYSQSIVDMYFDFAIGPRTDQARHRSAESDRR